MIKRKKRSHFMKLYLAIKDYIYYHIYFQYQIYWYWIFIFCIINFIVWDIFDLIKLREIYDYKIYIWRRFLMFDSIYLDPEILIKISDQHKLLYPFYEGFLFCSYKNINIILFLQNFNNLYLFKQVLLNNAINEYSWMLDILFTVSI